MRGLIAALQGLNCGEGSESSSSDIGGARGRVLNDKNGPECEDEINAVEEGHGRNEEEVEIGGCGNLKKKIQEYEAERLNQSGAAPDWEQ